MIAVASCYTCWECGGVVVGGECEHCRANYPMERNRPSVMISCMNIFLAPWTKDRARRAMAKRKENQTESNHAK